MPRGSSAGTTKSGVTPAAAANAGVAIKTERLAVCVLGKLAGNVNVRVAEPCVDQ